MDINGGLIMASMREERPISREALKNYARTVLCEDNATNRSLLRIFDEIIDNAPSDSEVD